MKIGLVRHFKVMHAYPEKIWITPSELTKWFKDYDASDIEEGETDLQEIEWEKCYSSDMFRAEKTASAIFDGEIIKTENLREVPAYPLVHRNIKLPYQLWAVLVRLAWLVNHPSQKDSKKSVEKRINLFLDDIISEGKANVLIVSHGALMIFMRRELVKRGFSGPRIGHPANGKLYLFEI
ncbi:histidine phosphatase family protein [Bacillus sp. FJAT-29790]|uniref:histidine phosphatase family protein n=1 Tax=Bacillus sp. FJAT-29790 TaxID=1895002 RepID=UPI001C24D08F|nr:histidine phosphatase family protein [Bacillus sp. FJAT-29790]MBU8878383.1 histidine phosphatase family protein [Bacillus sp. FJAT-29790]